MKPILFNNEMVRSILDARKTVTRRLVKPAPMGDGSKPEPLATRPGYWNTWGDDYVYHQPYFTGDILYVRETWQFIPCIDCGEYAWGRCNHNAVIYEDKDSISEGCFVYRADYPERERIAWRPSIHMPKEAARLFLRVTNVRAERLQDIDDEKAFREGAQTTASFQSTRFVFRDIWDRTIKPADRDKYGWDANPWVWVIEFERVSKEEVLANG